jgi:glucose-6-phosphate-specific signal transduction histidine kinase
MHREFIDENIIWLYIITATTLAVVLTAVFSLSHGINDIFPFFFLVPLILGIYAFPNRGVIITITLGWIYIMVVYIFGTFSARVIAIHTAWFFIIVSLGIVISHFAEKSRTSKMQIEQMKKEAFQQIENNMAQFATLNDQIRNPLQAIMLDTAMLDEKTKALVSEQVAIINNLLDRLDEKYAESEKVRKFLRKYSGFDENQMFK